MRSQQFKDGLRNGIKWAVTALHKRAREMNDWHAAAVLNVAAHALGAEAKNRLVEADSDPPSYQARVKPWLDACFGPEIASDPVERNHRFLEKALELVQATGCTRSEAHQLVDYVFGRSAGDPGQEVGGVMNTLAALCLARGLDMHDEGERELARVWEPATLAKIRAKQAAKPKHSPLPAHSSGGPAAPGESTGGRDG